MQGRLIAVLIMIVTSFPAYAQRCTPQELAVIQPGSGRASVVGQPSSTELEKAIRVAAGRGVRAQTLNVTVQYDRDGKVVGSSLAEPTHDEELNQAVLRFVNGFQISRGSCGTGFVPIFISIDEDKATARKNKDVCMNVIGVSSYCGCVAEILGNATFDQYVTIVGHSKIENQYDRLTRDEKNMYNEILRIKEKCPLRSN